MRILRGLEALEEMRPSASFGEARVFLREQKELRDGDDWNTSSLSFTPREIRDVFQALRGRQVAENVLFCMSDLAKALHPKRRECLQKRNMNLSPSDHRAIRLGKAVLGASFLDGSLETLQREQRAMLAFVANMLAKISAEDRERTRFFTFARFVTEFESECRRKMAGLYECLDDQDRLCLHNRFVASKKSLVYFWKNGGDSVGDPFMYLIKDYLIVQEDLEKRGDASECMNRKRDLVKSPGKIRDRNGCDYVFSGPGGRMVSVHVMEKNIPFSVLAMESLENARATRHLRLRP